VTRGLRCDKSLPLARKERFRVPLDRFNISGHIQHRPTSARRRQPYLSILRAHVRRRSCGTLSQYQENGGEVKRFCPRPRIFSYFHPPVIGPANFRVPVSSAVQHPTAAEC
jgi:hypothetical protein